MLSLMRKHAGSWLIKLILGAIVVVFVLWGVGSWTSQRSGRVATVNGDTITIEEYRAAYKRLLEQVRQSFGNNLNEDLIKGLQLEKQALQQLIDRTLLRQAAAELDLRVSDEELALAIRRINAFQTEGQFDSRRYLSILDRNNLSTEAFEISQRDALLIEKLNNFVGGSIKVSNQEVVAWYTWDNTEVDLNYVLFEPEHYQDISLTAEDTQAYFERHKESYQTEPKLKTRYLKFEPKNYLSRVEVSPEEIREYYDEHLDEFQTPKTVEARHILIKLDPEADPQAVAKAKERIEAVLQKAKDGQDFAELAKQFSEGPSKDKGGYLGTFGREAMVKPFADRAFSMEVGEISEPVRTQFGWHLIKIEKVNAAATTSLADAQNGIRKKLADERAKSLAYDEAESIYDASFEGRQLEKAAAEKNLTIHTTDFFSRNGGPEGIQNPAAFAAVAFDLPEGEVSEIQDFGDGFYILENIENLPAMIPELKTVAKAVQADLVKEKQDENAKKDAEAMLATLKGGEPLIKAAEKAGLKPKATGFFKRDASIPDIGFEREISRAAFGLSDQKPFPENVIKTRKGYYVIEFKQRKQPSMEEFDKQKADIKERLLQQKRLTAFNQWLEQLKNRSEISVEDGFLKG